MLHAGTCCGHVTNNTRQHRTKGMSSQLGYADLPLLRLRALLLPACRGGSGHPAEGCASSHLSSTGLHGSHTRKLFTCSGLLSKPEVSLSWVHAGPSGRQDKLLSLKNMSGTFFRVRTYNGLLRTHSASHSLNLF